MTNLDGAGAPDAELRDRAMRQLKKRRDFHGHLLVYLLVNGFLVAIWAMTNPQGFFWPVSPGRVGHRRGDERLGRLRRAGFSEEQIHRQMQRMERHR